MKKSVLLFAAFLIGIATLFAQAPDAFKYQAVARDASGDVIANQQVNITITILQGNTEGTSVYTETHDSTTNEFGLVNLTIGAGNPIGFVAIEWNNGPYFVKVEMDGVLMGTSQLLSVPYAKYADNAGNTFSGNYSDLTGTPDNVSTFTNDAGYLTSISETDPVFGAHAANGITTTNINNWISAYGWGNHSLAGYTTTDTTLNETEVDNFVANNGYLTSETDPVFGTSVASDITATDTTNWDTAFNWGNHSEAGYMTTAPTIRQSLESGNSADGAIGITGLAEISINTTGTGPDPSAILDISSTAKGVLLPRMNMTEILSIQDPESGLIVMDTTGGDYNFLVFDGLEWIKVIKNSSSYGGLVLWNKLGSIDEVENSKFGTGGTIVGTSYAFEPAYDGNGYVRKATGANYVNFPGSILQNLKEKGTIELWVNPKVVKPVPYSYGVFAIVGNVFGSNSHVYIAWGDGVSGTGFYGKINFDGTGHQTPFETEQFEATIGIPFHVVLCWDVNGIDGSLNTVRLYRDGEIVGSLDDTWDADNTTTNFEGFSLGMGPDGNGYDKFIVDELKVWDYAKTNFEPSTGTYISGDLEVGGTITGSINIDTIHVSQITGLLGDGYSLIFPDILDNLGILEVNGIGSNHVVVLNGPGYDVEAIENYNEWGERDDLPGRSMEHPIIFEADSTDLTWLTNMKSWFDESDPAPKDMAVIIPDVCGNESIRWNYTSFTPDGYEPGVDNRIRFTLINDNLPDTILQIILQEPDPFGSECSMNLENDPDDILFDGMMFGCPSLEVDTAQQVMTLTWDFKEANGVWAYFSQYFQGHDQKFQVIASWMMDYGIKQSTFDGCFPLHFEHLTGFGLDNKTKLQMKVWYVRMREM